MRARNSSGKQTAVGRTSPSFTESGRRAQIVAAAIEVIAEVGYPRATFAKIAQRAELSSTGMISYHFKGRDDLMREVVAEVMRLADGYMRPRIEAHQRPADRLRASIEGNLELCADYPSHLAALVEVLTHLDGDDPGMAEFAQGMQATLALQVERIREAQRSGEFGDFDPWVMVRAIRAAVDDVVRRAAHEPELDLRATGRELADLFERATRATA